MLVKSLDPHTEQSGMVLPAFYTDAQVKPSQEEKKNGMCRVRKRGLGVSKYQWSWIHLKRATQSTRSLLNMPDKSGENKKCRAKGYWYIQSNVRRRDQIVWRSSKKLCVHWQLFSLACICPWAIRGTARSLFCSQTDQICLIKQI